MYLSIATTHRPATDLGYLLMKNPDRVHDVELAFGRATVFFPEAGEERCEAVLVLDVDPVGLVRGRGGGDGLFDQYVNDRPYTASSFMSVALNRIYRSAMSGTSRERADLAGTPIPLQVTVGPLPVRDEGRLLKSLFEPLGWDVELDADAAATSHGLLRLKGTQRLSDALSHLYVLISVVDNDKHYWIGDDEVEKLLSKAGNWLPGHPERELVARRYLKNRRSLVRTALSRLVPEEESVDDRGEVALGREEQLERPLRLHDRRLDMVADLLVGTGASVVADLGCGEGRLIERLLKIRQFEKIIGLDTSMAVLQRAASRLKLDRLGSAPRVELLHGALTYRDERWASADAAALVEVIEHLDEDRLEVLCAIVFGMARPKAVVVTTPNAEYNQLFPGLHAGQFRHPDHRFEWNRRQFRDWASGIEQRYGYSASFQGLGEEHPEFGPITQVVVFRR